MFPLVLDSNDALAPGEMTSACAARLREAQIGFFSSHACWFNTSNGGDWTAAKMYLEVRRQARSKRDDKCAFMTLGLPLASGANKVDFGGKSESDAADMQFALNTAWMGSGDGGRGWRETCIHHPRAQKYDDATSLEAPQPPNVSCSRAQKCLLLCPFFFSSACARMKVARNNRF